METILNITTRREIFLQIEAEGGISSPYNELIRSGPESFMAILPAYNAMRESFPVREETEKHTEPYVSYGEGASEVSTMKWERLSIAPDMSPTN